MFDSTKPPTRSFARRHAVVTRHGPQHGQFGVGSYRSSSRPGQVGRVLAPHRRARVVRPPQAWKRRAGFVGQGSTSLPNTPSNSPVNNPGAGTTCLPPTGPPYPCPPTVDPRWWDFNRGCPVEHHADSACTDGVSMGCETPQPCGVNVIGANTLGTEGIPPGELVPLHITAGDAAKFHTKKVYFEALPFADNTFDCITISFGLRNVTRVEAALAEARRVLKPGGRFLCLEFSRVVLPLLDRLYDLYSFKALPAMGALVARDAGAYRYLAESIRRFPPQQELASMIAEAGLGQVRFRNLSGGIAAIHSAWRV